MGQVLHGSARTTEAVRRAIQLRQESVRAAAKRYGVSPTTVQKWRGRQTTGDRRMGPKEPRSTLLSPEDEAIIVAFRRHTLLPLDDCLYGLQPTIPHLTRSSLHRCLERHGISRLPEMEGDRPTRKRFASYPIGYFHLDIAQVGTEEGKLALFVAIDRTSKLAFAQLVPGAGKMEAARLRRAPIATAPYRIPTVLADNGIRFTARKQDIWDFQHIFDRVCDEHGIEHRLAKVSHPRTTDAIDKAFLCWSLHLVAARSSRPAAAPSTGWRRWAGHGRGDRRPLPARSVLSSAGARATAWRRAGFEAEALPRSLHGRSSFAAPVRAFGPRAFQPCARC